MYVGMCGDIRVGTTTHRVGTAPHRAGTAAGVRAHGGAVVGDVRGGVRGSG